MLFAEVLDFGRFKRVLDSGCGNGRNAVYLGRKGCEVYAIDISSIAISKAKEKVEHYGLSDKIHLYNRSMLDPLPFPPGYFDLILDSYVFCHFLGNEREKYQRNMQLLTRAGGNLIVSAFPPEDGYYGPMSRVSATEPVITDANNGISKRLYTERELQEYFSPDFQVVYAASLRFDDLVRSKRYPRRVLTVVFRRQ